MVRPADLDSRTEGIGSQQRRETLSRASNLLWLWTRRGISARYKQTLLGGAWAILQPLSTMLVFSLVFGLILKVDTGEIPYPIFAYTALLPWTFFAAGITSAISSLVDNMALITQVNLPRAIFPLAEIGARAFDFVIAAAIWLALAFVAGFYPQASWLWVIPLLALQILLMIGLGLLGSAVTVVYRDLKQAIALLLQLGMYATPVIYPVSRYVPDAYLWAYFLNPMAGVVSSYRRVLLEGVAPDFGVLGTASMVSLTIFAIGSVIFWRLDRVFGDIV